MFIVINRNDMCLYLWIQHVKIQINKVYHCYVYVISNNITCILNSYGSFLLNPGFVKWVWWKQKKNCWMYLYLHLRHFYLFEECFHQTRSPLYNLDVYNKTVKSKGSLGILPRSQHYEFDLWPNKKRPQLSLILLSIVVLPVLWTLHLHNIVNILYKGVQNLQNNIMIQTE